MQSTSIKGSAIGVKNEESTGVLGVLGITLDKKGHGSVRIAKNGGL